MKSQRFSAESISNEMILVRTLVFILVFFIIIVNCVQAHKIRHYKIALADGMQSEIKTGVETKLRMRIRSTEHLVDPKRENMAASCFLG